MIEVSKIGFYLFSGALGAVGVAATTGVLDTPLRLDAVEPVAIVSSAKPEGKQEENDTGQKTAAITPKEKDETPEAAQKPATPQKDIYPTFHLMTVELGSSALIAGNAAPAATIEILDGDKAVATTTSGANGDFVAFIDQALAPGDHQLTIRATDRNNKTLVSLESSLVSIPQDNKSDVLVMVTKPGEASRILNNPAIADDVDGEKTKAGAVTPPKLPVDTPETEFPVGDDKEIKVAAAQPETGRKENMERPEAAGNEKNRPVGQNSVEQTAKVPAATEDKELIVSGNEVAEIPKPDKGEDREIETVASEEGKNSVKEPVAEPVQEAKVDDGQPAKKITLPPPFEETSTIIVEAVEVENDTMYIAGAASPGRRIAIYVDNQLAGFTTGTHEGRFLLEAERALSRGNHVVRADIFDSGEDKVAARTEVPLIHEPREETVASSEIAKPKNESQLAMVEKPAERQSSDGDGLAKSATAEPKIVEHSDSTATESGTVQSASAAIQKPELEKQPKAAQRELEVAKTETVKPADDTKAVSPIEQLESAGKNDSDSAREEKRSVIAMPEKTVPPAETQPERAVKDAVVADVRKTSPEPEDAVQAESGRVEVKPAEKEIVANTATESSIPATPAPETENAAGLDAVSDTVGQTNAPIDNMQPPAAVETTEQKQVAAVNMADVPENPAMEEEPRAPA